MRDKDDMTIAWNEDKHAEMVEHIQALVRSSSPRRPRSVRPTKFVIAGF